MWQIELNGHEFTYPVDNHDNLQAVAIGLSAAINDYSDVYTATRSGTNITVTPNQNAWFTGMEVEPTEGGGTVAALFDVDNANIGHGFRSISFAPYYVTYTDTLFLDLYGPVGSGSPVLLAHNTGNSLDSGSNNASDPFLSYPITQAWHLYRSPRLVAGL